MNGEDEHHAAIIIGVLLLTLREVKGQYWQILLQMSERKGHSKTLERNRVALEVELLGNRLTLEVDVLARHEVSPLHDAVIAHHCATEKQETLAKGTKGLVFLLDAVEYLL